jgi:hypothetical protein
MQRDPATICFTDETLREGESRGFHPQPPEKRVAIIERIHEITGIRRFGVPDWTATNVLSDCDRETVALLLRRRGQGSIPEDLTIRLISSCGWGFDDRAAELIDSLPEDDRAHFSLLYVITGITEAILRPQEAAWLLRQQGRADEAGRLSREQIFDIVSDACRASIPRFFERGVKEVVLGIGDAFRAPMADLERFVELGLESGVHAFQLFDTVGMATPLDVAMRIRRLKERAPHTPIRVHFHNDFNMATANTVTAIEAGADGADVTVNGLGNRAGNANMAEVLMALRVIHGLDMQGVDYQRLRELSRFIEQHFGVVQSTYAPVTGRQISVLQASIERTHVIETIGERESYLAYEPAQVGDTMQAAHGPVSGMECVEDLFQRRAETLRQHGIEVDPLLVKRAYAWVERERWSRAETHRPRALAAIDEYEKELRASYVTDDDILAETLATRGTFARAAARAESHAHPGPGSHAPGDRDGAPGSLRQ